MALARHRHPGSRPRHCLAAGLQRGCGAAQGLLFAPLEECGYDVGARHDGRLAGHGRVCVCDHGDDLAGCLDCERVSDADGSGVGGGRAAAGDSVCLEGAEAVEAYVECGEWDQ